MNLNTEGRSAAIAVDEYKGQPAVVGVFQGTLTLGSSQLSANDECYFLAWNNTLANLGHTADTLPSFAHLTTWNNGLVAICRKEEGLNVFTFSDRSEATAGVAEDAHTSRREQKKSSRTLTSGQHDVGLQNRSNSEDAQPVEHRGCVPSNNFKATCCGHGASEEKLFIVSNKVQCYDINKKATAWKADLEVLGFRGRLAVASASSWLVVVGLRDMATKEALQAVYIDPNTGSIRCFVEIDCPLTDSYLVTQASLHHVCLAGTYCALAHFSLPEEPPEKASLTANHVAKTWQFFVASRIFFANGTVVVDKDLEVCTWHLAPEYTPGPVVEVYTREQPMSGGNTLIVAGESKNKQAVVHSFPLLK
jgi:hypothetical protein